MKVLFAASECAPFVKTGSLGDVVHVLARELARLGADVRVVVPKYPDIPAYWRDRMRRGAEFYFKFGWRKDFCGVDTLALEGVTYYFIDNEYYFSRNAAYGAGPEEGERFAYFCRAVLELFPHLEYYPDLIHCNDWQTGLIPALLVQQYHNAPAYGQVKTLFTIHNLSFQGVFPWNQIDGLLGFGESCFKPERLEFNGSLSFIKGGLVFADALSTVSESYAREIQHPQFAERLDRLLAGRAEELYGILNGLDSQEYDPATDEFLAENYSFDDLSGKAADKAALQQELGLAPSADIPLVALVTRLTLQKGTDLVEAALEEMMRQELQLIIIGSGEERYSELFTWAAWRYGGKLAAHVVYDEELARRVYAGADILLMPSLFEPCGISQLIAMRYGTIPVVRETGGLRDTVTPYNKYTDQGTGFSFVEYDAKEMLLALDRAIRYYHNTDVWDRMVRRVMQLDFSWTKSALQYIDIYERLTGKRFPFPEE